MNLNTVCGHTFISDRINSESVVLDLGANRGIFSEGMLKQYDCTVVAYEPSRLLCEKSLKELSSEYEKFSFNQNAIWSEEKTLTLMDFFDDNGNTSGVANSIIPHKSDNRRDGRNLRERYDVQCLSIDKVIEPYEKIDLLKIDIEGSEIEVLTKISENIIKKCDQVCVEFHLFCQHEYSIKITNDDIKKIIERMKGFGFSEMKTNFKHPDFLFYR
tara:strand:- start:1053 stop:1697 length:645 start_codon:yes stop_codon:yes gene_type:complete